MVPQAEQAVLVVDDEPQSVQLLEITLGADHKVYGAGSGEDALELLARHPEIAVAIVDQRMPGMSGSELISRTMQMFPHLIRVILTGYTDIESLIQAINAGEVYRYLTKPWNPDELGGVVRQGLERHRLKVENIRLQDELREANAQLRNEVVYLQREVRGRYRFEEIVGNSQALRRTLDLVERVVSTASTVLLLSETGTGKELIARAIHYNSPRADRPFVSENCGALSPELLTSELFGHKRGAFTGATSDRKGLFEVANGGTLFLDEIGDCPAQLQTRLLRVLDQGEIRRVGDNTAIPVDVRVIAATHHDLEKDVAAGTFRQDLFYRLNVFPITIPPLRERKEDIPMLVQHFVEKLNTSSGKQVRGCMPAALASLAAHDFPGNVRELQNEVERAHVLTESGEYIAADTLSAKFARDLGNEADAPRNDSLAAAVRAFEAQFIRDRLKSNNDNQTRTAEDLGLSRSTLLEKIKKYGMR